MSVVDPLQGLRFRVWGLGVGRLERFRVGDQGLDDFLDLGFRVSGFGFRI